MSFRILSNRLLLDGLLLCGCDSGEGDKQAEADEIAKLAAKPVIRPVLVDLEKAKIGKIEQLLERSSPLVAEEQVS